MDIQKRKVQEIAGSHLLVLPREWTKKNKIVKGSYVEINFEEDGSLKLAPKIEQKEELRKAVVLKDRYISRRLFREYLFGANIIEINAPHGFDKDELDIIHRLIDILINVEIIEESPNKIIIQNFGYQVMSLDQAFKRMYFVTKSMFNSCMDSVSKDKLNQILENDKIIHKFYFMIIMHLRKWLNQKIIEKELSSVRILDYRLAAEKVERIGDELKKLAKNMVDLKVDKKLLGLITLTNEYYEKAVICFLKEDFDKSCEIQNEKIEICRVIEQLSDSYEKEKDIRGIKITSNLLSILDYSKDISDLVR